MEWWPPVAHPSPAGRLDLTTSAPLSAGKKRKKQKKKKKSACNSAPEHTRQIDHAHAGLAPGRVSWHRWLLGEGCGYRRTLSISRRSFSNARPVSSCNRMESVQARPPMTRPASNPARFPATTVMLSRRSSLAIASSWPLRALDDHCQDDCAFPRVDPGCRFGRSLSTAKSASCERSRAFRAASTFPRHDLCCRHACSNGGRMSLIVHYFFVTFLGLPRIRR